MVFRLSKSLQPLCVPRAELFTSELCDMNINIVLLWWTLLEYTGHCVCVYVWLCRCNVSCRHSCASADKWHWGLNAAWILSRNVCVCVCLPVVVCERQKRRQRKWKEQGNISDLSKHLLFVQEKQFTLRAFGPLFQHQGEVLDAFDWQLLLQGQDNFLKE